MNEAAPILAEYNRTVRLKRIGYQMDASELDCFTEACFLIINSEIERLEIEAKGKRG